MELTKSIPGQGEKIFTISGVQTGPAQKVSTLFVLLLLAVVVVLPKMTKLAVVALLLGRMIFL